MNARPPVVCVSLSGRIGAGKTTLAKALCGELIATYVGIGDHVRSEAVRRGVPLERSLLQELGRELIVSAGGDGLFVRRLIDDADALAAARFVVDGVRALEMRDALDEAVATGRTLHVHVETSDEERLRRFVARGEDVEAMVHADAHSSESAVVLLREHADLVVAGDALEASVSMIVAALDVPDA
jgi:adenylate kinase family enzyme